MLFTKGTNTSEAILPKLKKKTWIDDNTDCWLWMGAINSSGYGHHRYYNKVLGIHIISAILFLEFNPESGLHVLHKLECKNRHCWNPRHLYIGTNDDNMRDKVLAKTSANENTYKTHCKYGHELAGDNLTMYRGKRVCNECTKRKNREASSLRTLIRKL